MKNHRLLLRAGGFCPHREGRNGTLLLRRRWLALGALRRALLSPLGTSRRDGCLVLNQALGPRLAALALTEFSTIGATGCTACLIVAFADFAPLGLSGEPF